MRKINSEKGLRDYLLELSVGDEEKRLQKKQASETKRSLTVDEGDLDEADDEADDEAEAKDAKKNSPSIEVPSVTHEEISSISSTDITRAINLIRAGNSTKEKVVQDQIRAYLMGLSKGERQSMYTFLLALANILVAGESGKDEPDPKEMGIRTRAVKPRSSQPKKRKKSEEKGTEESPITVGESPDKSRERLVLERHK